MVLFTAESPALVDACTVALLSANPDVKHLRDRIGAQIHRRLAAALGADVDPMVVRVLETSFSGSLLVAGMGHMPYRGHPPPSWPRRPSSLLGPGRRLGRPELDDGPDDHRTPVSRSPTARTPTRSTRTPTRSTPGCGPRRRSTATRSSTSGRCRGTRTCSPPSATSTASPTPTGSRSIPAAFGPDAHRLCRSWPSTRPATPGCAHWWARASPRPRWPSMEDRIRAIAVDTSMPPSSGARSTSSPTSPASSRWT